LNLSKPIGTRSNRCGQVRWWRFYWIGRVL
jgi:hypothetical protein